MGGGGSRREIQVYDQDEQWEKPNSFVVLALVLKELRSGVDAECIAFLKDAEKYTLGYRSIIERAPLQMHGAAL